MDNSKYRLKTSKITTKPPINSSRDLKIPIRELNFNQSHSRNNSNSSSKFDYRPASESPSRICIPLGFVSSSNVNIPLAMQKKLINNTNQRKILAGSIKNNNSYEYRPEKCAEKKLGDTFNNKENFKTKESIKSVDSKECTFGSFSVNKENNYVSIYKKSKSCRRETKEQNNEIIRCINRIQDFDDGVCKKGIGKPPLHLEMDSKEIEIRFQKLTNKLEKASKNIQDVINNSYYK